MPLLRAALANDVPLVALLPELNFVDRAVAELELLAAETGVKVELLLIPECGRGKLLFPGGESRRARALDSLLHPTAQLILGSVHALFAPAPPPAVTREAALELRPGLELPMTELLQKLVTLDYDDEYEAGVPGEFARRGGIIDVYSPAADYPCRVEFFGDTIESLRSFSPETQRSTGQLEHYPIIGRAGITAGGAADADCFDYLAGKEYRLLGVYPELCRERLQKYSGDAAVARFDLIVEQRCRAGRWIGFYDAAAGAFHPEALAADANGTLLESSGFTVPAEAESRSQELSRRLAADRIGAALHQGATAVVLAPHADHLPLLRKWCASNGFDDPRLQFDVSALPAGLSLPGEALYLMTEREFVPFGYARDWRNDDGEVPGEPLTPPASADPEPLRVPEFSLADLDEGDYCVHLDHGIGIFRGFRSLESRGISREVLVIEYRDEQLLYVPLLQAYKVSRYLGSTGKLKLHALGSSRWNRDKESARRSVRSYAADMLRLQAMRQSLPGIVFPADTAETRAFLRSFPYTDTPDQRRSTDEIRRDMESPRPMDRLLCGDVGYGKTEIAMRAVFKAVSNGYQAAILAPTTVLAQQHFLSFRERFAEYPFTIEMLSRFRTPAEQSEIFRRLAAGGIDIVIGTHRLCGSEVKFKNLGLVVIDEEQRFGVNHKERLRRFRAEVDVLTMSATPIPRTLYLAMAGARDLSTLMTAPKLRLPVKTVIAPEDDKLIAAAIKAELARGGQIYFLHNRVRTIEDKAERLRELVPEARFAVAHGQMPEHELEPVMTAFLEGKVDCLVCSTIVESGLDVPNANTIIIERADRFGLAELYQLRGRVGRWKHQAYAYLLLPRSQLVSSDARKRLSAIRRCSTLGAGFQLALHDLEIRGSGNLLGAEQSGHLNSIGFDLYCQLLKQEVGSLRGENIEFLPEVEIGIDFISFALSAPPGYLAAAFSPEYIVGERLRLSAYRRLGALQSEAELDDFTAELEDRYGKLPPEAKNLLAVVRLRILAARSGYSHFNVVDGKVMLQNPGGTIFRVDGRIPTIDYRDPPPLRLLHLLSFLSEKKVSKEKL